MHHPGQQPATRRLVAFDGSPSALQALEYAGDQHRVGDDLGLIHVSRQNGEFDHHLNEARQQLAERGIAATLIGVDGDPARTICITAENRGYDTIIIGRRNALGTGQLLLGPVASRVVAGAPGHVVVVSSFDR